MGIVSTIRSAIGGTEEEEDPEPSHRCLSCGEEYFTDPSTEIHKCRQCGGINVEAVQ